MQITNKDTKTKLNVSKEQKAQLIIENLIYKKATKYNGNYWFFNNSDIKRINEILTVDLFEHYETLPKEVQDVLERFCTGENSYEQCRALIAALEPLGYTCNYGLDGQPYDLTKINLEVTK